MNTEPIIFQVALAILQGTALLAPRVSVGPILPAVGPVYWACIQDPHGVEFTGHHLVPCLDERGDRDHEYEDDRSPFGAARLFVALVGEKEAARVLRKARGEDEEDEHVEDFAAVAEACQDRITPAEPAPVRGRMAALHVATMGPLPRCKQKPPKDWPEGMVGRWLGSGGGPEVLGACSGNCPRRKG